MVLLSLKVHFFFLFPTYTSSIKNIPIKHEPTLFCKMLQMMLKMTIPLGEHIDLGIRRSRLESYLFPLAPCWSEVNLGILYFCFSISSEKYNPPHITGYHENWLKKCINVYTTLLEIHRGPSSLVWIFMHSRLGIIDIFGNDTSKQLTIQ